LLGATALQYKAWIQSIRYSIANASARWIFVQLKEAVEPDICTARQQGKYQWIASVYPVSPDSETQRGSGKDIRLPVRLSFDAGGGPEGLGALINSIPASIG
jgi:hypothetical protein